MDITFLKAAMPLQKRFDEHGKHSYPQAHKFTSINCPAPDIKSFYAFVQAQAALGHCLLKSTVTRELNNESRAGSTDRDGYTQWLCLDADGLGGIHNAEMFLAALELTDISYVLQWSSSAFLRKDGERNTDFNAHIFLYLSEPVSPHRLKLWLKRQNFDVFKNDLTLTASDMALRWGLDISTCQNDKLLFIAPPDVHPPYEDTISDERIVFIEKNENVVPIELLKLDELDPEDIRKQEHSIINELRLEKGLEKRRSTAFQLKGTNIEYMANPSRASITDTKTDRGFVYFNLNGGDSWAYYHPEDNFEYVYNFKGEPTYRTAELLPAYHELKAREAGLEKAAGRQAIGFRGLQDGAVYNGFYDAETNEVELYMARRAADVILFLAEYGIEVESLPTFRLMHDPHYDGPRIDFEKKHINLFQLSELERSSTPNSEPTPTIDRLIEHVVGTQNVAHFINWLAYAVQYKRASGTGWVFHGSQGTGKGVLFHRVLRPIMGRPNAVQMRTANFEDKYNEFLENTLLVNVDEVDVPESRRDQMLMSNFKNYMTEPTISIRKMYANVYEIPNLTNWIFSSNKRNPVIVEMTDRRFNIADYQPHILNVTDAEIEQLEQELPAFMHHLLAYPVNERLAQTALITQAKAEMQALSETSVDEIANALILGKAHVLYSYCEDSNEVLDLDHRVIIDKYNQLVREVVCDGRRQFTRAELKTIFEATVGHVPSTPAKFTKYLRHHGINVGTNRIDGRTERGSLIVDWRDKEDWFITARREYGVMNSVPERSNVENEANTKSSDNNAAG